mmetsp:Transcript_29574/g.44015  ORF Transcript_29574/g.44015 Transcript_29574/m.44015 type:complete len:194 (-) Transcript_29574:600-1181(-)
MRMGRNKRAWHRLTFILQVASIVVIAFPVKSFYLTGGGARIHGLPQTYMAGRENAQPFSRDMSSGNAGKEKKEHVTNILFIECGFGNDSHGQSSTKAAVRACRNAIEFNSIPSIKWLVPGGYDNLKLSVILAVPPKYRDELDLDAVSAVFPYGDIEFIIQDGGMIAPSGIAIEKLGDANEDMVVVCASVTVGY